MACSPRLLLEPWWTLLAIWILYLATMPWSIARYALIKRQRGAAQQPEPAALPGDVH